MKEYEQEARMNGDNRRNRAALVAVLEVGTIHFGRSTQSITARLPTVTFSFDQEEPPDGIPPGSLLDHDDQRLLVLFALLRPPPWLARPPLLAISRCFAGSIAANPRFEPLLFDPAMPSSLCRYQLVAGGKTQPWKQRFNSLT